MTSLRSLPVVAIGSRHEEAHASLLVAAVQYRMLLTRLGSRSDVLLSAIKDLRRATVTEPRQQAELLELPRELAEHLNQLAVDSPDEQPEVRELRFIVQDVATGHVWQRSFEAGSIRPAEVHYGSSGWPDRIVRGSAGQPDHERVFVVSPRDSNLPQPPGAAAVLSALDGPTRFGPAYSGATHLDDGTPILMRVFVVSDERGRPVVLDPVLNRPLPGLTEHLGRLAEADDDLASIISPTGEKRVAVVGIVRRSLDRLEVVSAALRGHALRDRLLLDDYQRSAAELFGAVLSVLTRHHPTDALPLSGVELERRVSMLMGDRVDRSWLAHLRFSADDDGTSSRAARVLLAVAASPPSRRRVEIDLAELAHVAHGIDSMPNANMSGIDPTKLDTHLRHLTERLRAVAQPAMYLEASSG